MHTLFYLINNHSGKRDAFFKKTLVMPIKYSVQGRKESMAATEETVQEKIMKEENKAAVTLVGRNYEQWAKTFNKFGRILIFIFMVLFNIVFWSVTVREYLRPTEYYLQNEDSNGTTTAL